MTTTKIKKSLHTALGHSTPDRITVRGRDLPSEILGHLNLGDMAFLELTGRIPTPQESVTFNAIVVTLVEHGVTPSALAARLTYAGAPEALQAAVAAGLCGLGTVFVGSTEGAAKMLYEAIPFGEKPGRPLADMAKDIVADHRARQQIVPGLGHPLHKPIDPRTPRLFQIAEENGLSGHYVALMQAVQQEAERVSGKSLPINATGAIGAIAAEFGFPWKIIRGLGVMARAIGLVGHLLEEIDDPMTIEIWQRVEKEAGGPRQD
ncbi:citrate synthase [Variovorax beijingensis]|uniref:citrate synthase (unknown stereospecificity) n=1 Tax=Variovorax beijingensis TaxID=2496117 RepID=A0A561CC07_9BURK|nr:citryl-CoA lyase [Variovorax beijingensis]TWD88739.1 citrate synthase [Variovorax beijingensis]